WTKFGAAIRWAPASNAQLLGIASCGAALQVVGTANGWYRVQYTANGNGPGVPSGWVGSARVVASLSPERTCDGPMPAFSVGELVVAGATSSGCLSVRPQPSPDDAVLTCLSPGDTVILRDGPR